MNGPLEISNVGLAIAAGLILVNGALSAWLGLGLEKRLLVASVRTVVQLLVLGWILVPIFEWENPAPVLGVGLVMVLLAASSAVGRAGRRYRGIHLNTFAALLVSAAGTTFVGSAVIVGVDPWWEPRYLLPLLGMVLGNGLNGISLGLDRCLRDLDEGRDRVEVLLAYGATRWEAARPVAVEALRTGMIPIINSMMVVGLVTIPGMMTGQLLGGTPPHLAARYQIMIMFLIAAATALGATLAILLSIRALFDREGRLRPERLTAT